MVVSQSVYFNYSAHGVKDRLLSSHSHLNAISSKFQFGPPQKSFEPPT